MLSEESVSATPRRDALCVSLIIHLSVCIAPVWLPWIAEPAVRLNLTIIHAGTPEPVRKLKPIYISVRAGHSSSDTPADVRKAVPHKAEMPPMYMDYTPTAIPSDLLAMLDTETGWKPALRPPPTNTSSLSLPNPLREEPAPAPPEPPPGDLDVQPAPVIGGHLEPAVPIKITKPAYPALAKAARVEGIVVFGGNY